MSFPTSDSATLSQPLLPRRDSFENLGPPDLVEENRQWHACANLDVFFARFYKYWQEKGFAAIVASRILNLGALAFTIVMATFLLLLFDRQGLKAPCLLEETCDIATVAVKLPLSGETPLALLLKLIFLGMFSLYWLYSAINSAVEIWQFRDIQYFCQNRMGLSDAALTHLPWPELLRRLVATQRTVKLSLRGELSQHDIVMRVMRKDDFLIGMLNHGALDLHVPLPVLRTQPLLTTTVAWVLRVCLLDAMFDDHFEILQPFMRDGAHIAARFRVAAAVSAALSPFILVFLVIHFLLKHLERIYHHPSSLGKRRWSTYAYWRMREYGELPHFVEQRLNSGAAAAARYCAQFSSPLTGAVAAFVAYVAAGIAALVIGVALTHDYLMEKPAWGHTLVWWLAACGMVLAVSRSLAEESAPTHDAEEAMAAVALHTHWVPQYWRGNAHTRAVRDEFQGLFQLQLALFAEEAASVLLLPWLCGVSLARSAPDIAAFLHRNTIFHSSVGHVCSMAAFDYDPQGNPRYRPSLAPLAATPELRTRQEKVEMSLVSFAACYPSWRPPDAAAAKFVAQFDPTRAVQAQAATPPPPPRQPPPRSVPAAAVSGVWDLVPADGDAGAAALLGQRHRRHRRQASAPRSALQRHPESEQPVVGSLDSDSHVVEMHAVGETAAQAAALYRQRSLTGARRGGFRSVAAGHSADPKRDSPDASSSVDNPHNAGGVADVSAVDPGAVKRVTYGFVPPAELDSVAPAADASHALESGPGNAPGSDGAGSPSESLRHGERPRRAGRAGHVAACPDMPSPLGVPGAVRQGSTAAASPVHSVHAGEPRLSGATAFGRAFAEYGPPRSADARATPHRQASAASRSTFESVGFDSRLSLGRQSDDMSATVQTDEPGGAAPELRGSDDTWDDVRGSSTGPLSPRAPLPPSAAIPSRGSLGHVDRASVFAASQGGLHAMHTADEAAYPARPTVATPGFSRSSLLGAHVQASQQPWLSGAGWGWGESGVGTSRASDTVSRRAFMHAALQESYDRVALELPAGSHASGGVAGGACAEEQLVQAAVNAVMHASYLSYASASSGSQLHAWR